MAPGTSKSTAKKKKKSAKSSTSKKKSSKKTVRKRKEIDVTGLPRGVGRPSTYKPEYCQMLIDHMKEGFNFETFAAKLDYMSAASLYRWLDLHPEFREAKKIGEIYCQSWWLNLARGAAIGKIPNFNSTVWIFVMKNMFHWRDKHEVKTEHREIKEIVHQVEIGLDGDISLHKIEIPVLED